MVSVTSHDIHLQFSHLTAKILVSHNQNIFSIISFRRDRFMESPFATKRFSSVGRSHSYSCSNVIKKYAMNTYGGVDVESIILDLGTRWS
jgi:hypothetical protein